MKKIFTIAFLFSLSFAQLKAQNNYFTQNFDASNTLSDYVNSSPSAGQFNTSLTSGTGATVSIVNNQLSLTRTGSTGGSSITRYTNLGLPSIGIFQVSFDFSCAASTGASGTTYFTLGNLTSTDANSVAVPADASSLLKLKMVTDNTTSGNFYIQNIIPGGLSGRAPATGSYSGTQNVIAIINNTNCSAIYTGPDAVSDTVASLAMDLYINNTLVINDGALEQSSATMGLTGFKLNVSSNNSISYFDNIALKTIKAFQVISPSDPTITTQQLTSGNFTIGITDNGGGMMNQIIIPGIGDIMGSNTDSYGRGGQSAIRTNATGGTFNPTQAGFNETLGTQCIITSEPDKLTIQPRPCALWWSDAKYDFTQWENIGSDSFNSDGGNTDTDGIDESALSGKQETEVKSEFDYYGTYENYMNKYGITTPAIRHYFEYRFIRNPGNCLAQFSSSMPLWNPSRVQSDISSKYPAGVYQGTDQDMNFLITEWSLRNDVSIWNPGYRYVQDFFGNWQVSTRDVSLSTTNGNQNKYRQAVIIAESNDKNTGKAIGLYCPASDTNINSVIGVNEADGSITYEDNRTINAFINENQYRISSMSQYGFIKHVVGLINRSRLPNGTYEAYRQEYYIFYGTPQEIMDAIAKLDVGLGVQLQPQTTYFTQDFNSSVQITNYEGTTTNLLDNILITGTTGNLGSTTIIENKLNLTKANSGNTAFARSTDVGMPSSGVFQAKMDFDCTAVSGSSSNGTPYFALGNNIDATTVNIHPDANSYIKIRFNTDNTNSGNFTIQNLVNSVTANTSATFSGTNTLVMVFNKTASSVSYLAPDGVTTATLAPNKWDLYVNNNLVFDDANVNDVSQAITGFKFSETVNNANVDIDNMVISDASNVSVLPVDLLSFTGKATNEGIELNWSTASECNSAYFELSKYDASTNTYSLIAKVTAAGNSSVKLNYQSIDHQPVKGTNYYQLQQIDKDGKSKTYPVIAINYSLTNFKFNVYQTASNSYQYKIFSNEQQAAELSMMSLDGRILSKKMVQLASGFNTGSLPTTGLISGLYLVTLTDASNHIYVKKLVVAH